MSDTHLNGLAHLYINRDIALNYDDVIDEFGKKIIVCNFSELFVQIVCIWNCT